MKKEARKCHGKYRLNRVVAAVNYGSSDEAYSSPSIKNDWKNWVVMHGNEQVAVEDVSGIGKAISVKFNGDSHNMFNVVSRAGKGKSKRE